MKPKGLFVLDEESLPLIYSTQQQMEICDLVDVVGVARSGDEVRRQPHHLAGVQLVFSGWGGPCIDEALLAAALDLQIVFYGAGSIRQVMTEDAWQRGVRISSAYGVNAIPVAEFAVSQIIFCLKLGWQHALATTNERRWERLPNMPGAYRSTVGIVGLGQIGARVCRMLQDYEVRVIAYDPYATADSARDLDVELSNLDKIFAEGDVVSLHAPKLSETCQMVTRAHIESMKPGASLINTAQGDLIDEQAMIEVLRQRSDLVAVLDVTNPEPPESTSPLWDLSNAILLPHIAGSMDRECWRMGGCMVDELRRYIAGKPLEWEITREMAVRLA
ncbi:hydroxyacid dehydrogenase [Pirellulales bacterium]|nr:hydroxyacid dehydrogenase [Pirellulales bacterium]